MLLTEHHAMKTYRGVDV